MEITSKARFVRTAPDKLRILGQMVKDQMLDQALIQLSFSGREAAKPLMLLIKQAKAQAKDKFSDLEKLKVKQIMVNEGPKLKRRRIISQGRATAILKRMSHITVVLSDEPKEKVKSQKEKENGTKS